jgi:hypothetical protein
VATRYFTLEQARALLPRVRRSMGEALQLHGHLRGAIASLGESGLEVNWALLRGEEQPDDADERTRQGLARARMIYGALREVVATLEGLGVEVKSVLNGIVDFPSWRDGELEVLLCYKLGEADIGHYHAIDEGFAGRRDLDEHRFTSEREPEQLAEPHLQ